MLPSAAAPPAVSSSSASASSASGLGSAPSVPACGALSVAASAGFCAASRRASPQNVNRPSPTAMCAQSRATHRLGRGVDLKVLEDARKLGKDGVAQVLRRWHVLDFDLKKKG